MNVLSLFDGMSCGQIALTELGCFPDKYYASEVDKFAIQQTMHVFPDTIQIGDVTKVDVSKLDKIDLLIGGSPCQSFSCCIQWFKDTNLKANHNKNMLQTITASLYSMVQRY